MLISFDGSGVDDAERIAEIAFRISEYSQHRHVDAHESDCTTSPGHSDQVALRSSAPMASSTATRVSIDPETVCAPPPVRSSSRSAVWS
jgi:hypothetical protein